MEKSALGTGIKCCIPRFHEVNNNDKIKFHVHFMYIIFSNYISSKDTVASIINGKIFAPRRTKYFSIIDFHV